MKKVTGMALLCAVIFALAACGGGGTSAAGTSSASDASGDLYIGVYCLGNLEYFYDHKIGLSAAGEMLGVQTKYTGPADYDMTA
ncbi:MAG: hypothetical protein LBL44_12405, partial [Treponema sp.]|nr:hypothetical protein [Treponema sp.]